MKKILYCITKANWGGAQRYVFDMATNLHKDEFNVAVAYGVEGRLVEELRRAGIDTHHIGTLMRDVSASQDVSSFSELYQLFKTTKPDVVHLNSSKMVTMGALAARLAGVPKIISTIHGWAFNEQRPWYQRIFIKWAHWVGVIVSTKTICVSEFDFEQAQNWTFATGKVVAVHNGVGDFTLLDRDVAREKLLPGKKDALWVGANSELHKNKGLDFLLRAFAQTKTPALLTVAGDGSEKDTLQKLAEELGIVDKVFFLGFVDNARSLLKAYDLYVMPSRKEGLPYAILEAGIAGLPVVASRVGGIPEIVTQDSGILIEVGDINALAESIEQLLKNPGERRILGDALKEKVQGEFSLPWMIQQTTALYADAPVGTPTF